jgi:predicted alpha/beta hydrolase family esterase
LSHSHCKGSVFVGEIYIATKRHRSKPLAVILKKTRSHQNQILKMTNNSNMNKQVLFIQGGGSEEDYAADAKLVASLQRFLGESYLVHYPLLLPDESAPDFGRKKQIAKEISAINGEIILAGHSLGASMLLKYLSESRVQKKIAGIFLISTPFWSGEEDWKQGFKLQDDFADKLPKDVPIYLYHCRDDDEVPFDHLGIYAQNLPQATVREIDSGGHQLNNDLSLVAKDIKSL